MRQIVQALWWWIRVAVIVIVGVYALLSLWNNSGQRLTVWYWFDRREETSIVALAVASFLAGGVICTTGLALFTATLRYRRTREHRRMRAVHLQREELARKASMLRVKPPASPIIKRPPPSAVERDMLPIEMEARVSASPRPSNLPAIADAPIAVEATRATPFASTPTIAPGKETTEPLPIVNEGSIDQP